MPSSAGRPITALTNPSALSRLRQTRAKLWQPKTLLSVSEWADLYAYLPRSGGQAEPGKYRTTRCPYQRDMLDDVLDSSVMESIWIMASQMGKTLCEILVVEYFMDQDPTSILVVYPKIDDAKSWMRSKLMPHIEATPRLKGVIKPTRWRDSENTMLFKKFPGGELDAAGANSPSTLRQRSKRVVILDELDGYEPNSEGDPEEQADTRTSNFPDAVKLKSTTVTIEGVSRGQKKFDSSDKQRWFVTCPRCSFEQTLKWPNVQWPEGKPEEAWLQCDNAECRAHLNDGERIRMVLAGRWKATAPFRGYRGRHMNGLYRVMGLKSAYRNYLHEFVEGFLRAKRKGKLALMVWVNTFLCETFKLDEVQKLEGSDYMKRRENYTPSALPDGVAFLTCGVDCQQDRVELLVDGWGPGEESWGVEYRVIPGDIQRPDVWRDLAAFIEESRWKTIDGRELRIDRTCIDSSAFTHQVLTFCRPRFGRRIFAIKGVSTHGDPIISSVSRNNRARCPVYRLGTDTAKKLIYDRLQLDAAGPGFMHFTAAEGQGFDDRFFDMLTAEELTLKYEHGFPRRVWVLPEGRRNEALDCKVYSTAAMVLRRTNWRLEAKRLEKVKSSAHGGREIGGTRDDENAGTGDAWEGVGRGGSNPQPARRKGMRNLRRSGYARGWTRY